MSNEILSKVLDGLRTKINDFNYKNWFQNLNWSYEEPNRVIVKVPSRFARDWLIDHYLELIKFEFFRLTEKEHQLVFKIDRNTNKTLELFPEPGQSEKTDTDAPALPATPVAVQQPVLNNSRAISDLGFNPKYRFDNYVVGQSNQFVHAACQSVACQPARSYNPMFVYGGVGLGKTHLLNAMGLECLKKYPNWRVIYITGEKFTNEVISSIRYGKGYELRKRFRENCDMLLIDDIQFIAGKERTMEEFFHTFNTLYEARKQIVMSSDQLPKNIPNLEERLRSRFSWGLMADIQTPDFETRMAILRKKSEDDNILLPDDVCSFVASHVLNNVRDLEGALVRISAFASLAKLPITLDLAKEVLKNIYTDIKPRLSVEGIQNKVADFYNLKISDLKSKRRHKNLAVPRQIAMYLCKTHLGVSFPEIGHKFGGKDHTTVMHAVKKISKCIDSDSATKADIQNLEKILGVE
ncbi:MAG: chromosomal replication initiator protein DnaA [Deltaproteobacteria bacterium]|nr:chromosomal replication initiator protein DnaA [Deltaproteobacteria bacterium]